MCTALSLLSQDGHHFFGRTMDIAYDFNQSPLIIPRNYPLVNRVTEETWQTTYGILGMGTLMEHHPLLAEGFNEVGLSCAGLNFPQFAKYHEVPQENKTNIPAYDLMLWLLGHFSTVSQVRKAMNTLALIEKPFAPNLPVAPLHWMVTDKTGESIVIEQTEDSLKVYDNTVGVLTNSPKFDWHLTNLNQYLQVSPDHPPEVTWGQQPLTPQGDGLGTQHLPGGNFSTARFVRASFFRNYAVHLETKESTLSTFFHCLEGVSMISGTVTTSHQGVDKTIYTSAMDLSQGIYYYKTITNNQITGIRLGEEDMTLTHCKTFPYQREQSIHWEN